MNYKDKLKEDLKYLSFWELANHGKLDKIKERHKNGEFIPERDNRGLVEASGEGHLDVVKYLIGYGANYKDNTFEAFTYAAQRGHFNVVEYYVFECHLDVDVIIQAQNTNEKIREWAIQYQKSQALHSSLNADLQKEDMDKPTKLKI